jgi:hypothetical protein
MRLILLVFLCSISLQASAQWWRFSKRERLPALERPVMHHPNKNFITVTTPHPGLHSYTLSRSAYSLEVEEEKVMKEAQHNMRFRIYDRPAISLATWPSCMCNKTVSLKLNGIFCKAASCRASKITIS